MQRVDEQPLETIHLYVVREEESRKPPSLLPLFIASLCLVAIVATTIYSGDHPYYVHDTLRIPAEFLPLKTFTTTAPIIATGVKTIPATQARGTLTIYNGSILRQRIPQGMILIASSGIEVVINASVIVPAGNPPSFGIVSVSAHALQTGVQGNIPSFAINSVYGTFLYIRNTEAFRGGKHAYAIKVVTVQDRKTALDTARTFLTTQKTKIQAFLAHPCTESSREKNSLLTLSWSCQFVSYSVPSYMKVTAVRLVGKSLFVDVYFVPRPRIMQFK